jgi:hypothetical protein
MFDSIVTWWRQAVGRPVPVPLLKAGSAPEKGRQVWVCSVSADGPVPGRRILARVRNLFRNGIHLVLDVRFEAGDLLKVELPALPGQPGHLVLATVIHATACQGEWALDCVFASELPEEELHGFGAQRVKAAEPDRRTWVRFACPTRAFCTSLAGGEPDRRPAQVLDISASGMGLLVDQFHEAGTLLSLELHGPKGDFTRKILACVVRVNPEPDNQWVLGCTFIRELSEEELRGLQ